MKLGCLEYEKKNSANVKIKKKTEKTTNTEKKNTFKQVITV